LSEQTKAALDDAIRAHIADEYDGAITSSWVLVAEYMPLDGDDEYTHVIDVVRSGQSSMTTIGLTHFATQMRANGGENN
jgi:hypothetical protein